MKNNRFKRFEIIGDPMDERRPIVFAVDENHAAEKGWEYFPHYKGCLEIIEKPKFKSSSTKPLRS